LETKMRPVFPPRDLPTLVVEKPNVGAEGDPTDARWRGAVVRGSADGRVGDLRRAVEHVEDIAEDLEDLRRDRARQLRAAAEDDPQRRGIELGDPLAAQLERSLQHRRHDHGGRRAVFGDPREELLGVEAPAGDDLRAEAERERQAREAERVEHRRCDVGALPCLERDAVEQRAQRGDRADLLARRALGCAGRAAGQHHGGRQLRGRRQRRGVAGGD
jgi:hypothetical protein